MDAAKRLKNQKEFDEWEELAHGGRLYSFEIIGRAGGKAKYLKEVDKDENTLRFWQEIFDSKGDLIEIHQKFPEDTGHQKVSNDNS